MELLDTPRTPVQEFYRDSTIFLTGGTGFMGKAMIEKLLRSCTNLNKIILMIREKKGKSIDTRLDEIFQDPIFEVMKNLVPEYREKVALIAGDCSHVGLGLSAEDRQRIIDEVDIVFHAAATVRFNEHLKTATLINVRGTKDMLQLAHEITNLKCFMHVSTAYCNCNLDEIREQFYESPIAYNEMIGISEILDADSLGAISTKLLDQWPNTYAFTKAVAEDVVKELGLGLPIGVYRPAIIISTREEPVPGWIDNVYGPTGIFVGVGVGLIHVTDVNCDVDSNMVPVDMTIDGLLAAAWEVTTKHGVSSRMEDIPIYNYVSSPDNNCLWQLFMEMIRKHGPACPVIQSVWYPTAMNIHNKLLYTLAIFLTHFLPAIAFDTASRIVGKKPQMLRVYKKISSLSGVIQYFANKSWIFTNNNVKSLWDHLAPEDQAIFKFDMKLLDWDEYMYHYIRGCRTYIVKEDSSTLAAGQKRMQRFFYLHTIVKTIAILIGLRMLWGIINMGSRFI